MHSDERPSRTGFGWAVVDDPNHWDVDQRIRDTLLQQLVDRYGWERDEAEKYIDESLTRSGTRKVVEQLDQEFLLQTKSVLEVGSGLGNTLIELRQRGINA